MSETERSIEPGLAEAAEWFAKLNQRTVSHTALTAFRDWRQNPANATAYAKVERLWGKAAGLSNDNDIVAAIAAVRKRRSLGERVLGLWASILRRPVLGIGIAVATGAIGFVGAHSLVGQSYDTSVGEQRVLRLADGSTLRLDTDSAVKVRLTGKQRQLKLVRGQAEFQAARDPDRPFIVTANGVQVRALGTRFDVRRYEGAVRVTLVEGKVEVREVGTTPRTWSLTPGQQVVTGARPQPPRAVDVTSATSWTEGKLVFREQNLATAVAEVNRYSRRKIELDSRFADETISGVFQAGDTEAFLAAATRVYPLARTSSGNGSIVLRDRASAAS